MTSTIGIPIKLLNEAQVRHLFFPRHPPTPRSSQTGFADGYANFYAYRGMSLL